MRIHYVPSRRTVHAVWYVAAAGVVALVAWLVWAVADTNHRLEQADETLDRQAASIAASRENQERLARSAESNADAAAVLADQVRELGERPVVQPTSLPQVVPGPPGERGPSGPPGPGPSAAEVQSAVAVYCQSGRCDGNDPTTSQVAAVVAAYCDRRGECRGPAGAPGQDGADGRDGVDGEDGTDGTDGQDGADAPPPTQAQVDAAVARYCDANGGCRGPKGDRGQPGDDGADAVPFTFRFTVQVNPVQQQTYTCTVTAPDQTVTCSSDE
jgi:hypothetical protein